MTEWKKYTGSDEQIEEISDSLQRHGYITRNTEGIESIVVCYDTTHYLICEPHPCADMIKQWADTGQPVWIRRNRWDAGISIRVIEVTTTPDWNITGAEYSFTPFE